MFVWKISNKQINIIHRFGRANTHLIKAKKFSKTTPIEVTKFNIVSIELELEKVFLKKTKTYLKTRIKVVHKNYWSEKRKNIKKQIKYYKN